MDEKMVMVDAGDDMVMPAHYELEHVDPKKLEQAHKEKTNKHWTREQLKREFLELREGK